MNSRCVVEADRARFVVSAVDESLRQAFVDLGFAAIGDAFEREFDASDPNLPAIYQRFEVALEPMARQAAGLDSVPWTTALETVAVALGISGIDWWLVGSCALAVRGVRIVPRDIDIVVAEPDVLAMCRLLSDHMIEPLSINDDWVARYFCRGFPEARVEWVAGVREPLNVSEPSDFGPYAEARRELVSWRDVELKVPPLALQRAVTDRRGLTERATAIADFVDANVVKGP